jgi:hypothetical protein
MSAIARDKAQTLKYSASSPSMIHARLTRLRAQDRSQCGAAHQNFVIFLARTLARTNALTRQGPELLWGDADIDIFQLGL